MKAWKNCRGICLAEAMIAMAAGMVVLSATIQTLDYFQKQFSRQQDEVGRHQDQRMGIRVFEEELRLAGSGASVLEPALLEAKPQAIAFRANLSQMVATLSEPISGSETELHVIDGSGWQKDKHILICTEERCVYNSLARDGQRTTLTLTDPVGQPFPVGSQVVVTNYVRYSLGKDRNGQSSLMRQIDGGTNSLIGNIKTFALTYLNAEGKPTTDPPDASRVRVMIAVGNDSTPVSCEIGLRSR